MKTIITSLLLLICFNVSSQDTTTKERIILSDYRYFPELKDSILNVLKKMEYEQFMSIPQSEINLGLHKFKKQHITGNHLIIAGIASSFIGSLLMISSTKAYTSQGIYGTSASTYSTYPAGLVFTALGGGLTTAGFIVNIDSFRHLK